MKNLKIKNKKVLSFVLANTILISQCGCNNEIRSRDVFEPKPVYQVESPMGPNWENVEKKETIKKCDHDVCSKKKLTIREDNSKKSDIVFQISKYQKLKEIGKTKNGWSLVKAHGKEGYVQSKNLSQLGKTYIEVDISEQKLRYYKNGEKFLSTSVVTGKDSTPTVTGLFKVYSKNTNYTMYGEDYRAFSKYVLKFYKRYYIHDSIRTEYGGEIYHHSGSHGCVNTPYKKVKKLFEHTKLNTKVLVHK